METIAFLAHRDGSFDLVGPGVRVEGCYPALDGVPLRPIAVEHSGGADDARIEYTLVGGSVSIRLRSTPQGVVLSTTLAGPVPAELAVVGEASVIGADRVALVGWGTGGVSGVSALPSDETAESHALCGLCDPRGGTLVVSTRDFRRHAQVTRIRWSKGRTLTTIAFATERVGDPSGLVTLPDLHFMWGDDPWRAMRAASVASGAAAGARTRTPRSVHWCSWYYRYYHLTEDDVRNFLPGFDAARRAGAGVATVQIDAGYFPHCGDWLETNHRFPAGLQAAFSAIRSSGYRAGIWVGPLMVGSRSRIFAEHPDWVLHDLDGRPVADWRHYGEERVWGLDDEETYVLDTSHPEAMAYLREVFRTLRGWGATFFKTDFLYWSAKASHTVRRHTPGKTSVEYLVDLLEMIREEIGDEAYWLACLTPFAPVVGFADAARISTDVVPDWAVCQRIMRDASGTQPLNGAWFQNDPDAIPLRDWHTHLKPTEVETLALWLGGLGGVANTSEPLGHLPADRLALWRFVASTPDAAPSIAVEPRWSEVGLPIRLLVREFEGGRGIIAVNTLDSAVMEEVPLGAILGNAAADPAHAWQWGPHGSATHLGLVRALPVSLPARGSAVFYVAEDGTTPPPATWDAPLHPARPDPFTHAARS